MSTETECLRIISNQNNHYKILGVSRASTVNEIKQQYKKLVHMFHPDKNKSSSASVGSSEVKNTENKTGNIDKTANTTTDYTDKIIGKISGTSMSKYIKEFRETMLNIDMMVIEELEPLFMQIW